MRGDAARHEHPPDVSVILTLHEEGPLVRRTLLSIEEAAHHARRLGIAAELVAVLDRPNEATRLALQSLERAAFDRCHTIQVDHGSAGPARNSGIAAARGRYVMLCDGDDLISFNMLAEMVRLADVSAPDAAIFPEYLLGFGAHYYFNRYYPLDEVTPLSFLRGHPYTSRMLAAREAFESISFPDLPPSSGYAHEDWHLNSAWVACGRTMLIARDTVQFYRRRHGSVFSRSDSMSVGQIPPSPLFEPATFRRVAADAYARTGCAPEAFTQAGHAPSGADLDRPILRALLKAANAIEPAIEPASVRQGPFFSCVDEHLITVGRAYYEICGLVDGAGPFDEVFLLPFDSIDGADTFLRDVMFTLHDLQPQRRMLVLYGEQTPEPSGRDRVPPGSTVIDLGGQWPHLDPESREIIALRLIESVARGARLHLRDSAFAASFFGTYWPVLRAHPCVFYRFSDPRVPEGDDVFGRAAGQLFVSDHIEKLALVISDTETLVEHDRWRIGIWPERFQALPRRRPPLVNDSQIAVRTARRKGRVLWASRLERGKRPELVPRIAGLLAIAAPHVSVDVFGRTVMGHFDVAGFKGLDNVVYRGAYEDFERLDHAGYDCFLYTGWSDGLPAVVLEAMAAGLPVIAPAVEGIGEMVMDGGTGILLAVPADDGEAARMYVDAIVRLLDDPARRTRLALAALQRLNTRHAVKVHADRVRALFFPAGAPA